MRQVRVAELVRVGGVEVDPALSAWEVHLPPMGHVCGCQRIGANYASEAQQLKDRTGCRTGPRRVGRADGVRGCVEVVLGVGFGQRRANRACVVSVGRYLRIAALRNRPVTACVSQANDERFGGGVDGLQRQWRWLTLASRRVGGCIIACGLFGNGACPNTSEPLGRWKYSSPKTTFLRPSEAVLNSPLAHSAKRCVLV